MILSRKLCTEPYRTGGCLQETGLRTGFRLFRKPCHTRLSSVGRQRSPPFNGTYIQHTGGKGFLYVKWSGQTSLFDFKTDFYFFDKNGLVYTGLHSGMSFVTTATLHLAVNFVPSPDRKEAVGFLYKFREKTDT